MTRFVALGDSVTVGLGDPLPGRGWAGFLAESLAPRAELRNLADCGALASTVAADQLPRALSLRPTIAAVLIGVNDTLRGRFELAAIASDLEEVVTRLRDAGALVLTAGLPDPGLMLRVPELVRRPLARRVHAINAVLACLARRYETVHIDLAGHPAVYDRRMWGVDRLHPSERGHRMLARLFATGLAERGVRLHALPSPEPTGVLPTTWESAHWMATKGTGWVIRRSRDFLPTLTRLVLDEWWHEVRSEGTLLEARLSAELDGVLARVGAS